MMPRYKFVRVPPRGGAPAPKMSDPSLQSTFGQIPAHRIARFLIVSQCVHTARKSWEKHVQLPHASPTLSSGRSARDVHEAWRNWFVGVTMLILTDAPWIVR